MRRAIIATFATCLVMLAIFTGLFEILNPKNNKETLKVGFIYDNDESTAYTYNFSLAKDALEKKYADRIEILTCSNVLDDEMEEPLRDLAGNGCDIIFFNGYSEMVKELADEYPETQFCQTSYMDMQGVSVPSNYHTFKGEAYQGRYVSGIVAGMKLEQMISEGILKDDDALVGFVAAYPTPEVISGYTAFVLGVRSVVPKAKMLVSYTNTWSSYAHEKSAAQDLIKKGCVIISQHTDTIGPAIACEEFTQTKDVYFVGYNQSMSEVAPISSLITSRICWEPYILGAVDAVMRNKRIEEVVEGNVHGSDMSAGFEKGWVEVIDLNLQVCAPGTGDAIDAVIEKFKKGRKDFVYRGDYKGTDPDNKADTIDLKTAYIENKNTSYPLFHYILDDVITIVK